MALPEEILINLAANLAAELITRAGGRLRDLAFGDAETRALGRTWQRAFQAMLQAVAADLSAEDADLLADIWHEFVAAEGVAGALLDLALAGDDPPLPELRARFDALDFERATLAVDFDAALAALTRGLDAALLDEAGQPGSPLYNRVSLRRLTAMHRLLRQDAPPYRPGVPFQAPTVPRYFVPRPEVSAALMAYLSADAPHGALVVSAVHGLGGIGKTTLVAALAREPAVEARFPDGVLWATLGQTPDVLSLLAGWIQALGDYDFRPTVAESATPHLGTLLHDKACLLVVDDAWDAGYARPFLAGGSRCRVLVTTRRAHVAEEIGATLHDLDVMTPEQALMLLAGRLGRDLQKEEQKPALALARTVGHLPLALELAARQVQRGRSWAELRTALEQEIARLEVLAGPRERRQGQNQLEASLNLSLKALREEDEQAWEAFVWLGVLPEDALVTAQMAQTLWDVTADEAADLLEWLWSDALLLRGPEVWLQEKRLLAYRVHDVLHDIAGRRMIAGPPDGLGLDIKAAHARLLERYKHRYHIAYDQWHRLPDDGYIHERLTWHLERAGQPEAIHALLRLETEGKRNAWYEARETLGQTAGYLDDVRRAWKLAEAQFLIPNSQFATRNSEFAIGLQCRYVLIVASLNSLARNLPPELIAALVKEKVWTPAQGLIYARQTPNPEQRAEASVRLAPHLPALLLHEALTIARAIEWKPSRVEALVGLASRLPEAEQIETLCEALAVSQEIESEYGRARTLARLAPHLPQPLKGQILQETLAAARMIEDAWHRAAVLAELAPHLPATLLHEALAAAREIGETNYRASALAGLAPHLPQPLKGQVLQETLASAREIENEYWRAEVLVELAPLLSAPLLREALVTAREIGETNYRAEALVGLAPHLPELPKSRILQETLAVVRGIESEYYRVRALAGLAPHLPEPLLRETLAAAREIENKGALASALTKLAPRLAELGYPEESLATAREIKNTYYRTWALAGLVPYLPAPLLREALAVARGIEDTDEWAEALTGLVPHLPGTERAVALREALAAAREIEWAPARASALAGLAPHLPEVERTEVLRKAMAATWGIGSKLERARALAGLAPRLAELGYPEDALATARAIEDEWWRAEAWAELAPYLPAPLLREALATAREMESEDDRTRALAGLVPHLPEVERAEALHEALATAQEIKYINDRAWALARLAPHLPEPLKGQVLQEALDTARETENEEARTWTLAGLALHLPESLLRETFAMASETEAEWERAWALAKLAPNLAELPTETLAPLWQETLPILAARTRQDLLADLGALAPVIHALGGEAAIEETFRAVQDVGRWWE